MKKLSTIITALLFFSTVSLGGCAASKHYPAYVQAQIDLADKQAQEAPLVDLEFVDSGGQPINLVVNIPKQPIKIEQVRKNEWVAAVVSGIKTVGSVLGIYFVADAVSNMFESAGATTTTNTTNTNTTNTNSGDGNLLAGDGDLTTIDNSGTNVGIGVGEFDDIGVEYKPISN